jgi:hypothetical protein
VNTHLPKRLGKELIPRQPVFFDRKIYKRESVLKEFFVQGLAFFFTSKYITKEFTAHSHPNSPTIFIRETLVYVSREWIF